MTKAQLETKLRNTYLDLIREMVSTQVETDALTVGASELAIPCVDDEGNETFVLIRVSVPRGTRNGNGGYDPYDGYAVAEDYAIDCEEKAKKKADSEAKKQAKIARDQKKREEKKALADAKKNLKELHKIKLTEKKEENALHELTHEDGYPVEVHFLGNNN
jgi:hypothetical protein